MFNMQKTTFLPLGIGIWDTCVGQRMISVLTKRSTNVDQNFNTSRGMFKLSESIFTAPKTHFWAQILLLLWKNPKNAKILVIMLDTEKFFGMSSYDQNFFRFEKYEVRAFKRTISRPSMTPRSVFMVLYVSP